MRRVLAMGLMSLVLNARVAHAEPKEAALEYARGAGAESCPSVEDLRNAVASRLGYDPFRERADRRVVARIDRVKRELRGKVELIDHDGHVLGARELSTAENNCSELAASLSLAISVAIDPVTAMRSPETSPPPQPATTSTEPPSYVEAVPTKEAPPIPLAEARVPWIPMIALGGGVSGLGASPSIAGAFTLGGGIRHGAWSVEIGAKLVLPSSRDIPGGTMTTSLFLGELAPCGHLSRAFVCALLSLGALQGRADGIDHAQDESTFFAALGARVGYSIPIAGPFHLSPQVEASATMTPTRFNLQGIRVWSTEPLGILAGVRAEFHFE